MFSVTVVHVQCYQQIVMKRQWVTLGMPIAEIGSGVLALKVVEVVTFLRAQRKWAPHPFTSDFGSDGSSSPLCAQISDGFSDNGDHLSRYHLSFQMGWLWTCVSLDWFFILPCSALLCRMIDPLQAGFPRLLSQLASLWSQPLRNKHC